jgi:hypothetical protein
MLIDTVIFAVSDVWRLSSEDALLLTHHVAESPSARSVKNYVMHTGPWKTDGVFATTCLRKAQEPYTYLSWREGDEKFSVEALARHAHGLTGASTFFCTALGDGDNELSLSAWRNFLGFCESDPDVCLTTVLSTSRRLAMAA